MQGLEEYLEARPGRTELDWADSYVAVTSVEVVDMMMHGVVEAISETGTTIKGIQGICRHFADACPGMMENWERARAIQRAARGEE